MRHEETHQDDHKERVELLGQLIGILKDPTHADHDRIVSELLEEHERHPKPTFAEKLHAEWTAIAKIIPQIRADAEDYTLPTVPEMMAAPVNTYWDADRFIGSDPILRRINAIHDVLDQGGVRLTGEGDYPDLSVGLAHTVTLGFFHGEWHIATRWNLPQDGAGDTPEMLLNARALTILNDPEHPNHGALTEYLDHSTGEPVPEFSERQVRQIAGHNLTFAAFELLTEPGIEDNREAQAEIELGLYALAHHVKRARALVIEKATA